MKKYIKLLVSICVAGTITYAQSADSSVKQSASKAVGINGAVVTVTASNKKFIAHTAPTTKTNWSRVKDLFL